MYVIKHKNSQENKKKKKAKKENKNKMHEIGKKQGTVKQHEKIDIKLFSFEYKTTIF